MKEQLEELRRSFEKETENARTLIELESIRIKYLSRNGTVSAFFEHLKNVPKEQKPVVGKLLNELKKDVEERFARKMELLKSNEQKPKEKLDLTLPGRHRYTGTIHPITQTMREISAIFKRMGFTTATGPELEDDWHNFEALNFPPDHPARDMQDTFFISDSLLLRTHTSPVQIRHMMTHKPPVRVIMPGRVFRNEAISARSHMQFHQIEGLCVDEHVTFADLKGTLAHFARQFYGSAVKFKFRPTFFPFTEPSADMYISCIICGEKGCRICKYSGWLEILGSGMVHPNVLANVGYEPQKLTGFAFGIGIERTAMLKYSIDDIRLFFENDIRFLRQF